MRALRISLRTLLLFFIVFVEISSARRTKRQIIFEDDNTNRLFNADCQTPDRRPGRCVRLTSCRVLTQTVSRQRLRRYFCGFEGDEPRVCCPLSRDEVPPPTPRTTLRTTPRTVRTTPRPEWRPEWPTRRPTVRTTPAVEEEPRNVNRGVVTPRPDSLTRPPFLPASCGVSLSALTRIVGGSRAEKGSWPWMAVLFVRRSNGALVQDCGGALVTNQHVVTAAHCVVSGRRAVAMDPSRVVVRLGAHNLTIRNEPDAVDVDVEWIRRHEQFDPRTYRNDIAVVKLRSPVPFTRAISPVCLPYDRFRNIDDLTDRNVIVTGHGVNAFNGNSSDILMQAGIQVQSQEICRRAYEPEVQISNVYMCAGMLDGTKDACQGDSGGPLVAFNNNSYYLVGIVSFGNQCGRPNYPGVYTRVTEFWDWLARNLSE